MNNNYISYDLETLATDEKFVSWAKGWAPPHEELAWSNWLKAHPDKADLIQEAKTLVKAIQFKDQPSLNIDKAKLWNRIGESIGKTDMPKMSKPSKTRSKVRIRVLQITSLAAAAMIAFFIFNPFSSDLKSISTDLGEQILVNLPDQSTIILNAGSEIEYDEVNFLSNRTVTIKGEGFFEVEKGSPFTVISELGSVQVLGTAFNVYARKDVYEVVCQSGKVQVNGKQNENPAILTAGLATSRANKFQVDSVRLDQAISWLEGEFVFDSDPLSAVFESVARQFNVKVNFSESVGTLNYTGSYTMENIDSALYDITWPMGLTFTIEKNKVQIESQE